MTYCTHGSSLQSFKKTFYVCDPWGACVGGAAGATVSTGCNIASQHAQRHTNNFRTLKRVFSKLRVAIWRVEKVNGGSGRGTLGSAVSCTQPRNRQYAPARPSLARKHQVEAMYVAFELCKAACGTNVRAAGRKCHRTADATPPLPTP